VPFDSVFIEVVEHAETAFPAAVDCLLCVVGLGPFVVAGIGPGANPIRPFSVVLVGWEDLGVGSRPEPAQNVDWLQVLSLIAASEVAQAARRPDVGNVALLDEVEDHFVFLVGLDGNSVHAGSATLVSCFEPVNLLAGNRLVGPGAVLSVHLILFVPREVVPVLAEPPLLGAVLAEFQLRKGEKGSLLLGFGRGSSCCSCSSCGGSSRSGLLLWLLWYYILEAVLLLIEPTGLLLVEPIILLLVEPVALLGDRILVLERVGRVSVLELLVLSSLRGPSVPLDLEVLVLGL